MTARLTSILLVVGIGVGAGIAGFAGGIFANKLEADRLQQQVDGLKNDLGASRSQLEAVEDDLSTAEDELARMGADLSNLTQSYEEAKEQIERDKKALSLMSKIDLEMDTVDNELTRTLTSLQQADYELGIASIQDARVQMSEVLGQQRQVVMILEGSSRGARDSSATTNSTAQQEDWRAIDSGVVFMSKLHLAVFEDIIDVIDNVSDLITETKRIWNQNDGKATPGAQTEIEQLDEKYHDKIVPVLQDSLSDLANLEQMQEERGIKSTITAEALNIVEKLDAVYGSDLESLKLLSEVDSGSIFESMYTSEEDLKRLDEFRQYALDRINEDRDSFHIPPVVLGSNTAAQIHAEDVFKTGKISHWMTNGEKPYMTYTKTGGLGGVFQNVAVGGYPDYEDCLSGVIDCTKFDPFEVIDALEQEMVYNDVDCCDDGHKYNIINAYHTHVSIGIAHSDYFLVIVQNFENNYLELEGPLLSEDASGTFVNLAGRVLEGYPLFGITVSYDEPPSDSVYQLNRDKNYYDGGQTVAVVQPSNSIVDYDEKFLLEGNYSVITADTWIEEERQEVNVEFDLAEIDNGENGIVLKDGVYTIMLWLEDPWYGGIFNALTYSVFLN